MEKNISMWMMKLTEYKDYKVKTHDTFETYHINSLKKFEQRDDAVMISGMVIIEAELSSGIGVVDDEN